MDDRVATLDWCDAALTDKPCLSAVFDAPWRARFRSRALAEPRDSAFGFPTAYFWPVLNIMCPGGVFPPECQARFERGLAVLWPQMSDRDRAATTERLRSG